MLIHAHFALTDQIALVSAAPKSPEIVHTPFGVRLHKSHCLQAFAVQRLHTSAAFPTPSTRTMQRSGARANQPLAQLL